MDKELVYYYGQMDKKYGVNDKLRWPTFKLAFSILNQKFTNPYTVIETGCVRMENDWGAGMSTLILARFCKGFGGTLETVDLNKNNIELCKRITEKYADYIQYHVDDSINFLRSYDRKSIDLLYLDSYDYPYGQLLELYGGKEDIQKAIDYLDGLSEEEIVYRHKNIILASQEHCVNELNVAFDKLSERHIILIDDNSLPGGGKSRLAKEVLLSKKYTCLLDLYQSLWISPGFM